MMANRRKGAWIWVAMKRHLCLLSARNGVQSARLALKTRHYDLVIKFFAAAHQKRCRRVGSGAPGNFLAVRASRDQSAGGLFRRSGCTAGARVFRSDFLQHPSLRLCSVVIFPFVSPPFEQSARLQRAC